MLCLIPHLKPSKHLSLCILDITFFTLSVTEVPLKFLVDQVWKVSPQYGACCHPKLQISPDTKFIRGINFSKCSFFLKTL